MAVVVGTSNESKHFYVELTGITVTYTGVNQDHKFKSSQRNLKIAGLTQAIQYSIVGPNAGIVSGKVLAGETLEFLQIDIARISVRALIAGASARIWAWK